MKDIISKATALEKQVRIEKDKLAWSIKLTILAYGILLIFVFGYTTIAASKIKELATPQTIAVGLADRVERQIPELRKNLEVRVRTHAPVIAAELTAFLHTMIPDAETFARQQLDILADDLIRSTREAYMPQLAQYLSATIDEASKNTDFLRDKNVGKSIAEMLAGDLDKELDKFINDKFFTGTRSLTNDIDALASKSTDKMTALEASEKRVLMYWLFLVKHGEPGDSKIASAVRLLSFSFEFMNGHSMPVDIKEEKADDYAPVNYQF